MAVQRCVPDYTAALREDLKGMRIELCATYEQDLSRRGDRGGNGRGLQVLQGLGATLFNIALPPLADYQAATRTIIVSEAFAIHRENLL